MHLRIRMLNLEDLKPGDRNFVICKHKEGRAMITRPGILEWWDGLGWHEVKFVEKDAGEKSPYET